MSTPLAPIALPSPPATRSSSRSTELSRAFSSAARMTAASTASTVMMSPTATSMNSASSQR